MKKYVNEIGKLYEQVGFGKLETGKAYVTKKGSKLTISNIFIDASALVPEAMVEYTSDTSEGKTEKHVDKLEIFVDKIRNF